jgi:hypothetical protein
MQAVRSRIQGEIAQLVEHTTENRGVPGSSPGLAIAESPANARLFLLARRKGSHREPARRPFSGLFSAYRPGRCGSRGVGRHHLCGQVMHDPVDLRRRIDRLVARVDRRDDYGQLLARGQVIHAVGDVRDVEAWRAEIRRQARGDKIKVRTGSNEAIVWALLVRAGCPDALVGARGYRDLLAHGSARRRTATRTDPRRPGRRGARVQRRGGLRLVGMAVAFLGGRDTAVSAENRSVPVRRGRRRSGWGLVDHRGATGYAAGR